MINLVQRSVKNDFLRHNAVFFIGSLAVAVINYLYHPIVSRLLSVEEFGEVQVFFSLLTQATIPLAIFSHIALNLYTNKHAPESKEVSQSSLLMAYTGGAIALLLLLATPLLTKALSLSAPMGMLIVAGSILISTLSTFGRASLQASHRFVLVSIGNAINAGGKLLLAVLLILLGFGVLGAVAGFLLSGILGFLYIRHFAGTHMALPRIKRLRFTPELLRELKFGLIILFGTGCITFMTTADIIFAKYLFSAETAGLYAGISVVGRIIFFGASSVAGVLLTHVTLTAERSANIRVLIQGLALTALLAGAGLVVLLLAPHLAVILLVGSKYDALAHLLPLLALYVFVLTLVNICISYGIALRARFVIVVGITGMLATTALALTLPPTPEYLVYSFLSGSIGTLLLSLYGIYVHTKGAKR